MPTPQDRAALAWALEGEDHTDPHRMEIALKVAFRSAVTQSTVEP